MEGNSNKQPLINSNQVWTKLFQTKIYVIVYHDPWAHCECPSGCCCAETTNVEAVTTSKEKAEEWITNHLKVMTCYHRKDFDIEEITLNEGL